MLQTQKHTYSLRIQRGQAMIEYAILFILLTVLFIGGAEIGATALASYKNTDAAKTSISEYAEINQQRLNILNTEKQYLTTLAGYGYSVVVDTPFDNYIQYLDDIYESDGDYVVALTSLKSEAASILLVYSNHNNTNDPDILTNNFPSALINDLDLAQYDDLLNNINEVEKLFKRAAVPSTSDLGEDSFWAPLSTTQNLSKSNAISIENQLRLRMLLIVEHIKLSKLPLDVQTTLSEATIKLADHSAVTDSARCNPDGSYEYNLPNRYIYKKYQDDDGNEYVYQTGTEAYLFHPISIDAASCEGLDAARGNLSRLSILVNGYSLSRADMTNPATAQANFEAVFEPGLPKLNQAMYGLYTRVCVNAADEYVSCNVPANVSRTLLKPPGKICFENGGANADSCQGQPDEVTGFYRWGQSGTNINVADELNNGFRPAFQLDCGFQSNYASSSVFDDTCNTNPSKVRIHTRYRSVFEGFLNFGVQELQSDAAVSLFYNPNNVSRCGTAIIGGPGSEIGYLTSINRNDCNRNGFPTLKPHKDFRGCYEVDVETNQVSACN